MKRILILLLLLSPLLAFSQRKTLVPYRKGDLFGFSNVSGKLVIQPKYEWANLFANELAAVRIAVKDKKAYPGGIATIYINPKDRIAIKDTFEFGGDFYRDYVKNDSDEYVEIYIAQVTKDNETYFIDKRGRKVAASAILDDDAPVPGLYVEPATEEESAKDRYNLFSKDGKRGVLDGKEVIVPAEFDDIVPVDFNRGIFILSKNKKQAVLNISTNQPLKWYPRVFPVTGENEPMYYFIVMDYAHNEAHMIRSGLIDENNQLILNIKYTGIEGIDDVNGAVRIRRGSDYARNGMGEGIFDLRSKRVIEPNYDSIRPTHVAGIYKVEQYDGTVLRTFYVNIDGKEYYSK